MKVCSEILFCKDSHHIETYLPISTNYDNNLGKTQILKKFLLGKINHKKYPVFSFASSNSLQFYV